MQTTPTKRQYRIPSSPRTPQHPTPEDQRGQFALYTSPELKAKLSSMPRNARYSVSKGYAHGTGSPSATHSPHHSPQRVALGPTRSEPLLSSTHCSPCSSSAIFQSSTEVLNNVYSQLSPTRALQPMCETIHSPSSNDYHSPTKPSSAWSSTRIGVSQVPMYLSPSHSSRKGKRTYTEEELAEEAEKTDEECGEGMDVDMEMDDAVASLPVLHFGRQNGSPTSSSGHQRKMRNMPSRGSGKIASGAVGGGLGRTQSLPADVFNQFTGF